MSKQSGRYDVHASMPAGTSAEEAATRAHRMAPVLRVDADTLARQLAGGEIAVARDLEAPAAESLRAKLADLGAQVRVTEAGAPGGRSLFRDLDGVDASWREVSTGMGVLPERAREARRAPVLEGSGPRVDKAELLRTALLPAGADAGGAEPAETLAFDAVGDDDEGPFGSRGGSGESAGGSTEIPGPAPSETPTQQVDVSEVQSHLPDGFLPQMTPAESRRSRGQTPTMTFEEDAAIASLDRALKDGSVDGATPEADAPTGAFTRDALLGLEPPDPESAIDGPPPLAREDSRDGIDESLGFDRARPEPLSAPQPIWPRGRRLRAREDGPSTALLETPNSPDTASVDAADVDTTRLDAADPETSRLDRGEMAPTGRFERKQGPVLPPTTSIAANLPPTSEVPVADLPPTGPVAAAHTETRQIDASNPPPTQPVPGAASPGLDVDSTPTRPFGEDEAETRPFEGGSQLPAPTGPLTRSFAPRGVADAARGSTAKQPGVPDGTTRPRAVGRMPGDEQPTREFQRMSRDEMLRTGAIGSEGGGPMIFRLDAPPAGVTDTGSVPRPAKEVLEAAIPPPPPPPDRPGQYQLPSRSFGDAVSDPDAPRFEVTSSPDDPDSTALAETMPPPPPVGSVVDATHTPTPTPIAEPRQAPHEPSAPESTAGLDAVEPSGRRPGILVAVAVAVVFGVAIGVGLWLKVEERTRTKPTPTVAAPTPPTVTTRAPEPPGAQARYEVELTVPELMRKSRMAAERGLYAECEEILHEVLRRDSSSKEAYGLLVECNQKRRNNPERREP
jgi:hypothetical protein